MIARARKLYYLYSDWKEIEYRCWISSLLIYVIVQWSGKVRHVFNLHIFDHIRDQT